jgi:glycosyltransferase involved in cell wall biosynthesis
MLLRAIESARQAGTDVEVVVVDDASSDETRSICRDLPGIIYIRLDQNVGQACARNTGILRSSGEFIAFLDDDDLRVCGSIDKQVDLLRHNPDWGFVYGWVHMGDSEHCNPTGEIRPADCPTGDLFWRLLKGNFIYIPSVLVRKKNMEAVGLFDPSIRGTEDWDAWIRLAETHVVGVLAEPVAIYRDFAPTSGQTSSNRLKMCRSSAYTFTKALKSPRARAADKVTRQELHSQYMNFLFETLVIEGRSAISRGNFRAAIENYLTAIQYSPRRGLHPIMLKELIFDFFRFTQTQ